MTLSALLSPAISDAFLCSAQLASRCVVALEKLRCCSSLVAAQRRDAVPPRSHGGVLPPCAVARACVCLRYRPGNITERDHEA